MGDIVQRFLSFDKLMGTTLLKIVYYVGLAAIGLSLVVGLFGALSQIGYAPAAALGGLVIAPIFAIASVLFWRFICELYMLLFRLSDDVRDIRNNITGGEGVPKKES